MTAGGLPDPRTPWRRARFCVVDLELTGLDVERDELISFAAVPVDGGAIELGEAVSGLVRPSTAIRPSAAEIHGLLRADLESAPPAAVALEPLFEILEGRVLVAHFAWVERTFLARELARAGRVLDGPVIDTAQLALQRGSPYRSPLPKPPALGVLAETIGLPVHRAHTAEGDALTTAQVFLALATHLDRRRPQTVGTLSGRRTRLFGLRGRSA